MVVACLAATIGWTVGTCDVEKTPTCRVAAASPAAQVYVSKQVPLKLVWPPKPFQRATGTRASIPARSAMTAMSRLFSQVGCRCPSAVVAAQPLLTLSPKTPILNRLSLHSALVMLRPQCAQGIQSLFEIRDDVTAKQLHRFQSSNCMVLSSICEVVPSWGEASRGWLHGVSTCILCPGADDLQAQALGL